MSGLYCPECGSKDCPCHVPARDNLNTAADLEIDHLKANLRALEQARLEDGQRHHAHLEALRTELAATMAGADHLQTSLTRANERIADLVELLRMAGVTP